MSRVERGEDNKVVSSRSRSRSISESEMGWNHSGGALVCVIAFAKSVLSNSLTREYLTCLRFFSLDYKSFICFLRDSITDGLCHSLAKTVLPDSPTREE